MYLENTPSQSYLLFSILPVLVLRVLHYCYVTMLQLAVCAALRLCHYDDLAIDNKFLLYLVNVHGTIVFVIVAMVLVAENND